MKIRNRREKNMNRCSLNNMQLNNFISQFTLWNLKYIVQITVRDENMLFYCILFFSFLNFHKCNYKTFYKNISLKSIVFHFFFQPDAQSHIILLRTQSTIRVYVAKVSIYIVSNEPSYKKMKENTFSAGKKEEFIMFIKL